MADYSPIIQKENTFRKVCRIVATATPKTYYNASAIGHSLAGYIAKDFKSGERIPVTVAFVDAINGTFEFSLTSIQIAALEYTHYKLRIVLTFPSGDKVTVVESQNATVKP